MQNTLLKVFIINLLLAICTTANAQTYTLPSDFDYEVEQSKRVISSTYGDTVSIINKEKNLMKFGRNDDIGTSFETVWTRGGLETYETGNDIDKFSSSNAGDTQSIIVEGHTLSGSDFTFVTQTVTLAGQTETALTTPLARASRIKNNGSTDFAGTVYVYKDDTVTSGVPQTTGNIHLEAVGANNQSLKAATTTSSSDYWIITNVCGSVQRTNTRSVDFRLKVRESGMTFRTIYPWSVQTSTGTYCTEMRPHIIVPPNSDIKIDAISSGTTTGVTASVNGYLASIVP